MLYYLYSKGKELVMSKEIKKEEVKNSEMKSILKSSVGKLAILAATAATLSSCHHIHVGGSWGYGHSCGPVYMPNKCPRGHVH